jgi:Uroporphyrinogen decarboxylase (URO-D)
MTKKQRLSEAFALALPDRPPILGGWLAVPEHVQKLAGCSPDEYFADSFGWGLQAERVLGSDGIIAITEPATREDFRSISMDDISRRDSYSVDRVIAEFEALPDPEQIRKEFNEELEYSRFLKDFRMRQDQCRDILWCPADWELIPRALCYHEYGYESSMMTLALNPHSYRKWMQTNAERSRQKAILYARAIREKVHPGVILAGEDVCGQRGPLVAPEFLRREQFPLIEYALEPLLEAGGKVVLHIDGDWRLLLDDMLALGVAGLQGFQSECGMDIEWIVDKRRKNGDRLIIFGPLSVTTTLLGTPDDIQKEIRRSMEICREKASLVFFTSNTITPDVPLENVRCFWETVQDSKW